MMSGCNLTKLTILAAKGAALALVIFNIWVTISQLRDCDLIGLDTNNRGSCDNLSLALVFLVGLYVNINILLAIGLICSTNSLVSVGLGVLYGKSLFVIASFPFWYHSFPWFMGYSKGFSAAWMFSLPTLNTQAQAVMAVADDVLGILALTGIYLLVLDLENKEKEETENTLPVWKKDRQTNKASAGGDAICHMKAICDAASL